MKSNSIINNIKNFIFFDWKTKAGEIKYWKISFYIALTFLIFYSIFFNGYIVQIKDSYVKMDEYFVVAYDFESEKERIFKVEESWAFGVFDAAGMYGSFTKDKFYYISSVGIRIPLPSIFSTFPNIISVKEIKVG
jgi:hypothetical protein